MERRSAIIRMALFLFAALTVILYVSWMSGPFFYHFTGIRTVTLYSFAQITATALAAFAVARHYGAGSGSILKNARARPFFISGVGFSFLALDEILSLHENMDKLIHAIFRMKETPWTDHIDDLIVLAYGVVAFYFIKEFFAEFGKQPFMIPMIACGVGFFFFMVGADFMSNNEQTYGLFFLVDVDSSDLIHMRDVLRMLEDSAKLIAGTFFLTAFLSAFLNEKLEGRASGGK